MKIRATPGSMSTTPLRRGRNSAHPDCKSLARAEGEPAGGERRRGPQRVRTTRATGADARIAAVPGDV